MDLTIIIVSWNTRDLLIQCLASIFRHPPSCSFEVILVDNASTDGSAAVARERFPSILLLENLTNPGFAAANNQAIAHSRGHYVLLLNPDTVIGPGSLDALVDFMTAHVEAGVAGSMLLNPNGSLQPSCHPTPTLARELWRLFHLDRLKPFALYPMQDWALDRPRVVDSVQGASLMIRRETIQQIGLLDESYFMYSEEVDWCVRIRRGGWLIFWVPASRVFHFGGQSTRQVPAEMFEQLYRAKLQFIRGHHGAVQGIIYKVVLLAAAFARVLVLPFVCLFHTRECADHVTLAKRYGRLILELPGM